MFLKTPLVGADNEAETKLDTRDIRASTATDVGEIDGDVIIVLDSDRPMKTKQPNGQKVSEYIMRHLQQAGLQYQVHNRHSKTTKFQYFAITATLDRLKAEAKRTQYNMQLDAKATAKMAEEKFELHIPEKITSLERGRQIEGRHASIWKPYQYLFNAYDDAPELQALFGPDPFPSRVRSELIMSIIKSPKHDGGANIRVQSFLHSGRLLAVFLPHDRAALEPLMAKWGFICKGSDGDVKLTSNFWRWPSQSPVQETRDYFGEKIGMYYLYLSHYTTSLFPFSIVGLACYFVYKMTDYEGLELFFSAVTIIWSSVYLESLKNKQADYAKMWGTASSANVDEAERPEFKGKPIKSYIDGTVQKYVPPHKRIKRFVISTAVVALMVLLVIAANAIIFWFRWWITVEKDVLINGFAIGSILAAIASAVQVLVMGELYGRVVKELNNYENHRTDADFQSYFIVKTFFFHFINTYSSLFYIAFIEESIGDPCSNYGSSHCAKLLELQLFTLFGTAIIVGNFFEVALPYFTKKAKERKENFNKQNGELAAAEEPEGPEQSEVEKQFLDLEDYDMLIGLNEDYREMVLQFGYCTLFTPAFPALPALAYLNNFFELKVDAFKICINSRRPAPERAADIGAWFTILEFVSNVAVVTNAALVVFVSNMFYFLNGKRRLVVFVLVYHFMFIVKAILAMIIDDVPQHVTVQLQREEYITSVIFGRGSKEDEEQDMEEIEEAETDP